MSFLHHHLEKGTRTQVLLVGVTPRGKTLTLIISTRLHCLGPHRKEPWVIILR